MTEYIMLNDDVEANRDIPDKRITKGDRGIVVGINNIDSEDYLDIELSNGDYVYCSSENCWTKVRTGEIDKEHLHDEVLNLPEDKDREFTNIWNADENNTSKALFPRELIEKAIDSKVPGSEDLAKKLDHYLREVSKDDELSLPTFHPGTVSAQLDKILHGGLKCGELFTIGLSTPGPYKSDIVRSLYFQKAQRRIDLKAFIDKGEATASVIHEAQRELDQLTKSLSSVSLYPTSDDDSFKPVFISQDVGLCPDMSVGIRGMMGPDGKFDINSYNLILGDLPKDELPIPSIMDYPDILKKSEAFMAKDRLPLLAAAAISATRMHEQESDASCKAPEEPKTKPSPLLVKLMDRLTPPAPLGKVGFFDLTGYDKKGK